MILTFEYSGTDSEAFRAEKMRVVAEVKGENTKEVSKVQVTQKVQVQI